MKTIVWIIFFLALWGIFFGLMRLIMYIVKKVKGEKENE